MAGAPRVSPCRPIDFLHPGNPIMILADQQGIVKICLADLPIFSNNILVYI